jgi:hypothetical protein
MEEPLAALEQSGKRFAGPTLQSRPRPHVAIAILVAGYFGGGGNINRPILDGFREHGISIPFPQREVRLLDSTWQPRHRSSTTDH